MIGQEHFGLTTPKIRSVRSSAFIAAFVAIVAIGPTSVTAGSVDVSNGRDGGTIVEANDATIDEILHKLGQRFDFSVERITQGATLPRVTGTIAGTIDAVLARLLRHEGYVVVRSVAARSGISRILLLESKAPATVTQTYRAPPSNLARAETLPAAKPSTAPGKELSDRSTNPVLAELEARGLQRAERPADTAQSDQADRSEQQSAAASPEAVSEPASHFGPDRQLATTLRSICVGSGCR